MIQANDPSDMWPERNPMRDKEYQLLIEQLRRLPPHPSFKVNVLTIDNKAYTVVAEWITDTPEEIATSMKTEVHELPE